MQIPEILEFVAVGLSAALVVLLPIEVWRRRRRGLLTRQSVKEMAASAGVLLPNLAGGSIVLAFIAGLFRLAESVAPWRIPTNWATTAACLLLVDFLYYWDHRTAHSVRLLWAATHSVHHSSPQYDQTTGLRVSVLDGFTSPWFYVPAVLAGFDPMLVGACFGVILAYQQWLHTEAVGRLGWFDAIFNSPSNHRVHHGVQPEYIDRNYGAVLILWDRMFGTYASEATPPRYGLTEPINSSSLWTVHVAELERLWLEFRAARHWSERLTMLFGPPGETGRGKL